MDLVTVAHFIPACKNRVRKREKERRQTEDVRRSGSKIQGKRGGRKNSSRTNEEKTRSECSSNSMRGRFGSPIFGPEHFQAHPLRPLQTRPPPRIELSVQISILTANLPANSPLLLVRLLLSRVSSPSATSISMPILSDAASALPF